MEQVYLAPCTEYQYEPLKQAVDDIFDHLALNRFLFQGANVVIKPNLLMKCNPDTAIITPVSYTHLSWNYNHVQSNGTYSCHCFQLI